MSGLILKALVARRERAAPRGAARSATYIFLFSILAPRPPPHTCMGLNLGFLWVEFKFFMEEVGGGSLSFAKGNKFPLAGRLFSWRAQGGFRISPLRALQTTRNPPETGCSTGACGPPRRNRLPPGRNRSDKGRRIFPLLKRAMRVWAAAQRAPGSARPFQGGYGVREGT